VKKKKKINVGGKSSAEVDLQGRFGVGGGKTDRGTLMYAGIYLITVNKKERRKRGREQEAILGKTLSRKKKKKKKGRSAPPKLPSDIGSHSKKKNHCAEA